MEYSRQSDLKVTCIATPDDMEFFGISIDDILDRTPAGFRFLKKAKELCAMTQKVEWTNTAYTLQIIMLPDGRVSFEFSEEIADYVKSLKHSMSMADEQTIAPLKDFIQALEEADEDEARRLVARFERNVRETKLQEGKEEK